MKRTLIISLLVAAMGVMAFVGCERETIEPANGQPQQRVEDSRDAQTTQQEQSIVTAQSRRYMNAESDSLYIITTQTEYESIFGDYVFEEFPSIDFSNYTLLFAQGSTPNLIGIRNENLTFEDNIYTWNINIVVGDATQPDYWGYAALINRKAVPRSNIVFNLNVGDGSEPQNQRQRQ